MSYSTSKEKLIFLDFDGVLHPSHFAGAAPFSRATLLEETLALFSPKIVISSSWRFTHSLASLKAKLPSYLAQRVIDVTGPAVIGKHARYQEITAHAYSNDALVQWRALDDSYWEFPSNCQELIRCNPNTGIGPKEVAQLSSWLSN
jgi:hypothetical protein